MTIIENKGYLVNTETGEVVDRVIATSDVLNMHYSNGAVVQHHGIITTPVAAITLHHRRIFNRVDIAAERKVLLRRRVYDTCAKLDIDSPGMLLQIYHAVIRVLKPGESWAHCIAAAAFLAVNQHVNVTWRTWIRKCKNMNIRVTSHHGPKRTSSIMRALRPYFSKPFDWHATLHAMALTHSISEIARATGKRESTIHNTMRRFGYITTPVQHRARKEKKQQPRTPRACDVMWEPAGRRGMARCMKCGKLISNLWIRLHVEQCTGVRETPLIVSEPTIEFVTINRGWPQGVRN